MKNIWNILKNKNLIFLWVSIVGLSCEKRYLLQKAINRELQKNSSYVLKPCNDFINNYNISVEFCEDDYLIDTENKAEKRSEHPWASKSNKVIFIHFTIDRYKKLWSSNYPNELVQHDLYIIDDSKPNNSIVKIINIDKNNPEIVWMDPKDISPNYASLTTGTIRTSISWNAQLDFELYEKGEKKFKFYIKTTYPRISQTSYYDTENPPPCHLAPFCTGRDGENAVVDEIPGQTISLKNYQIGPDNQINRQKVMNLYMFSNGQDCDMTQYIWNSPTRSYSFAETFSLVWAGEGFSDIYVLPNFLPNNGGVNYKNAINNSIPEFLVSKDGYIVLTEKDFKNGTVNINEKAQDKVKAALNIWKQRFFSFLNWKNLNPSLAYDGISNSLMPNNSDCKLNIGALITVKGCKIYNWDENKSVLDLKNTQFVYDSQIGDSVNIEQINNKEFNWFGVTFYDDYCRGYVGLSIVFRNTHLKYTNIIPGGFCIATAMHELAHLWNPKGSNDFTLATTEDQHHAHVKGNDSDYCLMRMSPSFGYDYEDFYIKQIENMKFSDGVEQRLTNTMIYKR